MKLQGSPALLNQVCASLSRWSLRGAALGLVGLVLCVQWQVVGRYLLNDTPTWTEPVALLLVLYITALAVAVGVRDAGHLGLESLIQLLPARVQPGFMALPQPSHCAARAVAGA
jgi:TRAP-type C4-dicarboxylate transport system permease small subunit